MLGQDSEDWLINVDVDHQLTNLGLLIDCKFWNFIVLSRRVMVTMSKDVRLDLKF